MKMRNVGPKKITQSLLEGPKTKKTKQLLLVDDEKQKKKNKTFRTLSRKDPEDLSEDERKKLRKLRKERKKKRELDAMLKGQAEDNRASRKDKKLSKSRDLVVSSGVLNLSAKDKRELRKQAESYFGNNSSKIMEMLETGDSDGGITVLKKTLLMTIIRVLPMAEQILTESGTAKGTYQFVTLISQMREIMSDIQADRDKQFLAQSITEQIIRPSFMNIAQQMLTEHHSFRKKGDMFVIPAKSNFFSEQLLAVGKDLANFMQTEYKDISVKLSEALKN
jgi:hypothetical protein